MYGATRHGASGRGTKSRSFVGNRFGAVRAAVITLVSHERRPPRQHRARASRRRDRPRRRARDRLEARRAGGADPRGRPAAGPARAARRRGADPDPDHPRHRRPRRARRPAPLLGPPARRGGAPALPRRQGRDRPADRERLLLRLRLPGADHRRRPRADRGGGEAGAEGRSRPGNARGSDARRGARALPRRGRAVQGRARRHRRGRHHPLRAGRLRRPLPRPAPAELEADQGLQADEHRRRLLARRRAQQAADPHLRHRLLLAGRSRRVPRRGSRTRAGATTGGSARSSTSSTSRTSHRAPRSGTRRGWRSGTRSSRCAGREREARLPRGEDAADVGHRALEALGPLGEVRRPTSS